MEAPHSYTEPVFIISVASDILGIHPQTLRFYEREELVIPHRTDAGQRLYSQKDVDDVREIRVLTRERGVNLAGVKIILEMRCRMVRLQDENENLKRRGAEPGDSV
jgi:MerR family transcriptional regulator/heat shock protein HspR